MRRRRLALVRVLVVSDAIVVLIAGLDGPLLRRDPHDQGIQQRLTAAGVARALTTPARIWRRIRIAEVRATLIVLEVVERAAEGALFVVHQVRVAAVDEPRPAIQRPVDVQRLPDGARWSERHTRRQGTVVVVEKKEVKVCKVVNTHKIDNKGSAQSSRT